MGKDIYNTLKVGDTIKCNDPKDMVSTMQDLAKSGIEADFMYEKDGKKGYWLIVTGEEMTPEEKAQIEYLRKRKSDIIENLVYACEEINRQIADVKAGRWLKAIKEIRDGSKD